VSLPVIGSGQASTPVGVGELAAAVAGRLVAYALGSCVGIAIIEPATGRGALAHVQLPSSRNASFADDVFAQPGRYADTAVPKLLEVARQGGARLGRLRVVIAGGASFGIGGDHFQIGARNITAVRKALWLAGLIIDADDTGGTRPRTLSLELPAGRCGITVNGEFRQL
jgi:chemotaxis protein CheD